MKAEAWVFVALTAFLALITPIYYLMSDDPTGTAALILTFFLALMIALYLAIVALIPTIAFIVLGVGSNIPFGGASILIVVGVGLETVKQIESQLQQRHYEGFLR